MKRRFLQILLFTILLCFYLTGCQKTQPDAQQAFAQTMQALSSGDLDAVNIYFPLDDFEIFKEAENRQELLLALINTMQKTSYTIFQEEKTHKEVRLHTLISSPDNGQILKKYLESLSSMVASKEYQQKIDSMTKTEYQTMAADKLIQILKDPLPVSDHTLDITMIKTKGEWRIADDQTAFYDLLFAGLGKSADALL